MTPRAKAVAEGKARYFNGKPCPKGHIAERSIHNCGCLQCVADIQAKPENRAKHIIYAKKHYQENKVGHLSKVRKWRSLNPEKVLGYGRKFHKNNRDACNASSSEWQKANPERAKENVYRWRRENPEKFRAITINRRARLAANGGVISGDEIAAIVAQQKGRCAACRRRAKLEMDHITPVARGGPSDASNFQGLCRSCNARKSAKHPIDFNRSLGLLL